MPPYFNKLSIKDIRTLKFIFIILSKKQILIIFSRGNNSKNGLLLPKIIQLMFRSAMIKQIIVSKKIDDITIDVRKYFIFLFNFKFSSILKIVLKR